MHTLTVSISLPDASHPDMQLRLSSEDSDCDVVLALPVASAASARVAAASTDRLTPGNDDYVLGGYAGI